MWVPLRQVRRQEYVKGQRKEHERERKGKKKDWKKEVPVQGKDIVLARITLTLL